MSSPRPLAGLILAAGKGTRMKSEMPKALFRVCGVPMVELVIRAMHEVGVERPIVIVGHQAELVTEMIGPGCDYATQSEQKGTGHAALMAKEWLEGHDGPVLVAPGDAPLLTVESLRNLRCRHEESGAQATLATCHLADPTGYGRILRSGTGAVVGIVEERDATTEEKQIDEINAGIYCFDAQTLLGVLPRLSAANAQGEYYLTDVVAQIVADGGRVVTSSMSFEEALGVNDRWQLAEAERILRKRILRRHALAGVTIRDPDTTSIGVDVEIEPDVEILPMTSLEGRTRVAVGAIIGPGSRVIDSEIGPGCRVLMSQVHGARLERGAKCGPFANLRPGSVLGEDAKVGNFVEIKKSVLGPGVAAGHLAYLGDAEIGAGTNIGAGTITCNFDGFSKHRTEIGANAFVGSNSTLVAPVTIGDGAIIGAGSVITKDVPADALGLGRARQENKEEWAPPWRNRKRQSD